MPGTRDADDLVDAGARVAGDGTAAHVAGMSSSIESRLASGVRGFLALAPANPVAAAAAGRQPGSVEFCWATGEGADGQGNVDRLMVDARTAEVLWRENRPGWGSVSGRVSVSVATSATRRKRSLRTQPDQPTLL